MMTEQDGVWLVYTWDMTIHPESIHATEIDALRAAQSAGYFLNVKLIPFGVDVTDATK